MTSELHDQLQMTLGTAYHVERELAGGGMAHVFLAEEEALKRRVVVKVLAPDLAQAVSIERFKREIKLAGHLNHPHIVPVLSAGQSSELLYYTMPLIEGETLRALIDRERQLPLELALMLTADIADALDCAHRENVVHRDIKPENILIERTTGHALVTDFGIARAIEKSSDIASVTSTGLTLGTPTYMSPEQAAAEHHIDGRSDIYSLGCVLYEMLGGSPPFTGPTARAIIAQHLNERPRSLRVVRPDLPTTVDETLQKALAKTPAERHASGAALLMELKRTTPTPPPAPLVRRGLPWRVVASVLLLLAVLLMLYWITRH